MKAMATQKAPGQIGRFFRDIRAELRKVTWPTWKETSTYFVVVLLTLAFFIVVFLAFDTLLLKTFFQWLLGIKVG